MSKEVTTMRPKTTASSVFTKYVGTFSISSHAQPSYVSLGRFSTSNPAKGFSIALDHPGKTDAVETKVTTRSLGESYELILQVSNPTNEVVSAEIWQM